MEDNLNIQWFPGHMAKTRRLLTESIKQVDLVAEIRDARIPLSSANPEIAKLVENKPRIILLNKCDMADEATTLGWIKRFKNDGLISIAIDAKSGHGLSSFIPLVSDILKEKRDRLAERGLKNLSLKIMIVGIPNVGKSSFINRMSKGSKAKVEDRPGVTRGNQWYNIGNNVLMLDTPGVLWPKFDDDNVAQNLAFTGAVKDAVMDVELLAVRLLDKLKNDYSDFLCERYKLSNDDCLLESYDLLQLIGRKRGMLISGGEIDTLRASNMLLDEFRGVKIGRITLELP